MTDNTFLQEAAKVLQDAHERWFYLTRGYGAGEKASVHDAELEREVFQGTIGECVAFIDQHIAAVFLRWLLTREPTEQMLKDGRDVLVTREKEFPAVPEYVSGIYRAMNAALLKEIEG